MGACPSEALRSVLAVALAVRRKGGGEQGLGVLDFRILPTMLWVKGEWLARERGLAVCGCCGCCNDCCAICCVLATPPPACTMEPVDVLHGARDRGVSVRSCETEDGRDMLLESSRLCRPPVSARGSSGCEDDSNAATLRVLVRVA